MCLWQVYGRFLKGGALVSGLHNSLLLSPHLHPVFNVGRYLHVSLGFNARGTLPGCSNCFIRRYRSLSGESPSRVIQATQETFVFDQLIGTKSKLWTVAGSSSVVLSSANSALSQPLLFQTPQAPRQNAAKASRGPTSSRSSVTARWVVP